MKERIQTLIGKNKIFDAIKLMHTLKLRTKEKKILALLESRLNELNEKIRLGILSEENTNLESNKIKTGLLEVCDTFYDLDTSSSKQTKPNLIKWLIVSGILLALLTMTYMLLIEKDCNDRKVAILVADFQNTKNDSETDGFANSLVTRMDNLLNDNVYDVSPVGYQSRKEKRYDKFIQTEYFESTCDTAGLFVNGFLSMENKVFNVYITLVNLQMKVPGFGQETSIGLDNPNGIEFSISNDAKFLADFIFGIIKSYEGKPYDALEKFFELEKNDSNGIIKNDNNFKATIAYFKGNCYAMRGDNFRARSQYKIVSKYGNPELKEIAENNSKTADEVNKKMKEDPVLKLKLNEYKSEHSNIEIELQKILNNVEKGINNVIGKLKKK